MDQKIIDVAKRIKELREILGVSVEEMARVTNVSEEAYEDFEAGKTDFTFTFIYRCAHRFNVDVTDLLGGESPTLSTYCINRAGDGLPIARRRGFRYENLAPRFRDKRAEPFHVSAPYDPSLTDADIKLSRHEGHEFDLVVSGKLRVCVDGHCDTLCPGDSIYYDSTTPHGMIAEGGDCEFIAVIIDTGAGAYNYPESEQESESKDEIRSLRVRPDLTGAVSDEFVEADLDDYGIPTAVRFKNADRFNFAFDIVDKMAKKSPDKLAMLHIDRDCRTEHSFTFADISRESSRTANYFASLGIKKGDRVMLVLKRHYQFWFSIVALHKLGAIVIPATNLLVEHDFDYRFRAAGVKAIVCTADGETARHADAAARKLEASADYEFDTPMVKILVNGHGDELEPDERIDGWHDFNVEYKAHSDVFERTADSICGSDPMIMYFSSGTTGYPKAVMHACTYALSHYYTARYWHNVDPNGIHLTIADTGWGKAVWGKLYGQWMCEAAVFVFDFDRFHAAEILPMFKKYNITTFCAPPTIYRFFIKENLADYDLSTLTGCTIAGEALNPEVYEQWTKAVGIPLMEGFGQTETTLVVANPAGGVPHPGSMGVPSPIYDVDIVRPDGTPADIGETGEIIIRTDREAPLGLFLEYYRNKKATDEAWHDGMYHTGDTAWRDEDGYYHYVGRIDDLIKSSGYRIGPFEIESVIMELPYVLECAVTAAPDPVRGQVVKATIVLIKGKDGSEELKKEIQTYVKTNTAPYKYPRIVEFVAELPKTISGKIRRVELRNNDNKK